MKKVTYFLALMFAVVLISTSCEEETLTKDDDSIDSIISSTEFIGTWDFVSYEYEGETYTDCNMIPSTSAIQDWVVVNATTLNKYDYCQLAWFNGAQYRIEVIEDETFIIFGTNAVKYKILSYDKSTKTLRIMLKYSDYSPMKVGGIKTFQKQ